MKIKTKKNKTIRRAYTRETVLDFLACMIGGNTVVSSARKCGVNVGTARGWLKKPKWQEELASLRAELDRQLRGKRNSIITKLTKALSAASDRTYRMLKQQQDLTPNELAGLLRALTDACSKVDSVIRLDDSKPQRIIEVKEAAGTIEELRAEMRRLNADPDVAAALKSTDALPFVKS